MKLFQIDSFGILWLLLISSFSFNATDATRELMSNSKEPNYGHLDKSGWNFVKPIDRETGKPVTSHQLVEVLLPRVEQLFDIKSKRGKREAQFGESGIKKEFHTFWPKVCNEESRNMLKWLVKKVQSIDSSHSNPKAPHEPTNVGLDYLNTMLIRYIEVTQLKPKTKKQNSPGHQTGSKNNKLIEVPFEGISDLLKSPVLEELTLYEAYMELVMLVAILDSFSNEYDTEFKRFKLKLSDSNTQSELINPSSLAGIESIEIEMLPDKVVKDIKSLGFANAYRRMAGLIMSLDKYLIDEARLTPSQFNSLQKQRELSTAIDSKKANNDPSPILTSNVVSQLDSKKNQNSKSILNSGDIIKLENKDIPQPVSTFTDMSFGKEDDEILNSNDGINKPDLKSSKERGSNSNKQSETNDTFPSTQSGSAIETRLRPMPKHENNPVRKQETTINSSDNDKNGTSNPVKMSTLKDRTEEMELKDENDQTIETEFDDEKDQTKKTKFNEDQTETMEDDENVTKKEIINKDGNKNQVKIKVLKKNEDEPYISAPDEVIPRESKDQNLKDEVDDSLTIIQEKLSNINNNKSEPNHNTKSENITNQDEITHTKEAKHLVNLPEQPQLDKIEEIGDKNHTSNVTSPTHTVDNSGGNEVTIKELSDVVESNKFNQTANSTSPNNTSTYSDDIDVSLKGLLDDIDSKKNNQTTNVTSTNTKANDSDYSEVPITEPLEVTELPKNNQTDQYRNSTTHPNQSGQTSDKRKPVEEVKASDHDKVKVNEPQKKDEQVSPKKDNSLSQDTSSAITKERKIEKDPSPPGKTLAELFRESNPSGGKDSIAEAVVTELMELGVEIAYEYYVGKATKGLKYVKKAYDILKKGMKNPANKLSKADKKKIFERFKKIVTESKSTKSVQRKLEKEFGKRAKSRKKNKDKNQKPDLDEDDLPDIDIEEIMEYFEEERRKLEEGREDSDSNNDNEEQKEVVKSSDEVKNVDQELNIDDKNSNKDLATQQQPESGLIDTKSKVNKSDNSDAPLSSGTSLSIPAYTPLPVNLKCPELPPLNINAINAISTSLGRLQSLTHHNWPFISMTLLRNKLAPLRWQDHPDTTNMEVGGIGLLGPDKSWKNEMRVGVIEKVGRDHVCLSWYNQDQEKLEMVKATKDKVDIVFQ